MINQSYKPGNIQTRNDTPWNCNSIYIAVLSWQTYYGAIHIMVHLFFDFYFKSVLSKVQFCSNQLCFVIKMNVQTQINFWIGTTWLLTVSNVRVALLSAKNETNKYDNSQTQNLY